MTTSVRGIYHIVQPGESLSYIAGIYYNDPNMWHRIYDANIDVIGSNPDHIEVGMELYIP